MSAPARDRRDGRHGRVKTLPGSGRTSVPPGQRYTGTLQRAEGGLQGPEGCAGGGGSWGVAGGSWRCGRRIGLIRRVWAAGAAWMPGS